MRRPNLALKEGHVRRRNLRGPARPAVSELCGRLVDVRSSFPKDAGEPYDDISWELPANYHLTAVAVRGPAVREARARARDRAAASGRTARRRGPGLRARRTPARRACSRRAFASSRFKIEIAEQPFSAGGRDYPRGSWILPAQPGLDAALGGRRRRSGTRLSAPRGCPASRPRTRPLCRGSACGCRGRTPTASAGCVMRSTSATFPTPTCATRTCAAATCASSYDVLLYGHVDLELAEQIEGIPKAWGPMPFKKTTATPSHGTPAESDDITGGVGYEGLAEIQRFVDDGGLLITLGNGIDAGARGRPGARRAPRVGRRAAQRRGRRKRRRRRLRVHRDAHARARICA